jgi:hypothetical protein
MGNDAVVQQLRLVGPCGDVAAVAVGTVDLSWRRRERCQQH